MKTIMSTVPIVRFKEFTESWKKRKVGDFLTTSRISGHTGLAAKKLTVKLWGKGIVEKSDAYQGSENTQYYIRHKGQFMYGKLDFLHAAFGIVPEKYDGYESTIDSPAFDIHGMNEIFLLNRVGQTNFYLRYGNIANGSRKAMRIHEETFLNMPIVVPSLKEQSLIGRYIICIDKLITLYQSKMEQQKNLKKYFLQNMFPAKGEKVPRIRLKGFSGDWQRYKIGDITNVLSASRVHKEEWASCGVPFFRSSDVVAAFKGTKNDKAYISFDLYNQLVKSSGKLEKNDILITGGGSIGTPYIVPDNQPLYSKDADLIWIKHSSNFDSRYLYIYFTTDIFKGYLHSISHTGTIAHYTIEQVKDTPVTLPMIDEQRQIGNYISRLNNDIMLYQRKIEVIQSLKKYMLQNMFI